MAASPSLPLQQRSKLPAHGGGDGGGGNAGGAGEAGGTGGCELSGQSQVVPGPHSAVFGLHCRNPLPVRWKHASSSASTQQWYQVHSPTVSRRGRAGRWRETARMGCNVVCVRARVIDPGCTQRRPQLPGFEGGGGGDHSQPWSGPQAMHSACWHVHWVHHGSHELARHAHTAPAPSASMRARSASALAARAACIRVQFCTSKLSS